MAKAGFFYSDYDTPEKLRILPILIILPGMTSRPCHSGQN